MKTLLIVAMVTMGLSSFGHAHSLTKLTCHDQKADVWFSAYFAGGLNSEGQGPAKVFLGNKQTVYKGEYSAKTITEMTRLKGYTKLNISVSNQQLDGSKLFLNINLTGMPTYANFFGYAEISNSANSTVGGLFLSCSSL